MIGKACARVQRALYKEWDEKPLNSTAEGAQSINDVEEEEGSGCFGIGDVHASMAAVWGSCEQRRQSQGAKGNAESLSLHPTAISASNTSGAWDNAKKYIEAGALAHARTLGPMGSDAYKATVIGDTVGDLLKDTSGPSLNILINLMAIAAVAFFSSSRHCSLLKTGVFISFGRISFKINSRIKVGSKLLAC
ncbi:hypothetical protein L7F22_009125 [Adiantum nelumboides]|nr:hypothetical protein [Adiantum nelumboides]